MKLDPAPPVPLAALSLARAALLDHLPKDAILARYENAGGKEVSSGKFANPESSAALAANAFGFFLHAPELLSLPGGLPRGLAASVTLEAEMRFPWSGGRHPWLDVGIETDAQVLGIESKRYEPFRDAKRASFSTAYARTDWGPAMAPFERLRENLVSGAVRFDHLDAAQLVKHAFGLRTQAAGRGKAALLIYLYAEPGAYPDGRAVSRVAVERHRREVEKFTQAVAAPKSEVLFLALRYGELLESWGRDPSEAVRAHAAALRERFDL